MHFDIATKKDIIAKKLVLNLAKQKSENPNSYKDTKGFLFELNPDYVIYPKQYLEKRKASSGFDFAIIGLTKK